MGEGVEEVGAEVGVGARIVNYTDIGTNGDETEEGDDVEIHQVHLLTYYRKESVGEFIKS